MVRPGGGRWHQGQKSSARPSVLSSLRPEIETVRRSIDQCRHQRSSSNPETRRGHIRGHQDSARPDSVVIQGHVKGAI